MVRHPFAVAESLADLADGNPGWTRSTVFDDDRVDWPALVRGPLHPYSEVLLAARERSTNPFRRVVLLWCISNLLPIISPHRPRVVSVFYEHLVMDPASELDRIRQAVGIRVPGLGTAMNQPSRTDSRGTAAEVRSQPSDHAALTDRWLDAVPSEDQAFGFELLRDLALDGVYGASPMPVARPAAAGGAMC
jgi:hypothetical protein